MKHFWKKTAATAAGLFALAGGQAAAQEFYLGQIIWGGWNFCPRGTATANGALLSISQNQALFSLLGTQYGGDGRTTFGLPDLQGRMAMGQGNGAGLTPRREGEEGGSETETLTEAQIPSHDHDLKATTALGNTNNPNGAAQANGRTARVYSTSAQPLNTTMNGESVADAGGSQSHNNLPPYTVVRACIVTVGTFPSRN
ncbi:phage tail protein [Parvularcula sp. ZS-1/3]|uniref:Phage tail protein n=1 Tax=Parvularcula mediterranea TaxID=2732508 RepID=A0A7Y3RKQ8_9PROT|nr:tail fiber protein [Parvularcula mediterranea]NNU15869.1 phage tail protein [Parvularcula mediterranea]